MDCWMAQWFNGVVVLLLNLFIYLFYFITMAEAKG